MECLRVLLHSDVGLEPTVFVFNWVGGGGIRSICLLVCVRIPAFLPRLVSVGRGSLAQVFSLLSPLGL